MLKPPRLESIINMSADDWYIVNDLYNSLTKAEWCELYFHLYQELTGTPAPTLIVDDARERLQVIESHHHAMRYGIKMEVQPKSIDSY